MFSFKKYRGKAAAKSYFEEISPASISDTALPFDSELLEFCRIDGIFAYGIFNPMGPTISTISLLSHESHPKVMIHYQMLNPFAQNSFIIGVLSGKPKQDELIEILPDIFIKNKFTNITLVGSLPTFFMPGSLEHGITGATALYQHINMNNRIPEMSQQLQLLKKYIGKPWDRTSHEMAMGLKKDIEEKSSSPFTNKISSSIKEWIEFLASDEHRKPEMYNFSQAWLGSIDFQKDNYLGKEAMQLEQMLRRVAQSNPAFLMQLLGKDLPVK